MGDILDQAVEKTIDGQALDDLISHADFKALAADFNNFCPFEAVGMVRAEIRHSNYLSYVLNPSRPHGFKTTVLRAFLETALGAIPALDDTILNDAEIRREWRNIDLLILLPKAKRVVAVELKIDAFQSEDQLERYRTIVQTMWPGWTHDFRFLTKRDEKPNDDAWQELKLHNVMTALDAVAQHSDNTDKQALAMLQSYVSMMRRHHLGNDEMETRARELWSKHEVALSYLMDRRPYPLRDTFDQILENDRAFAEAISSDGIKVIKDHHTKRILRFAFQAWDELTSFQTAVGWTKSNRLVLLEIKLMESTLSAFLVIGPGSTADREKYVAECKSTKRNKYIFLREDALATFSPEGDFSYESVTESMATFVNSVFNDYDAKMKVASTALQAQRQNMP